MSDQRVYLVDDDAAVLDSLDTFFQTAGYQTACFASAKSFLDAYDSTWKGCAVLDVDMPGMSGLDLQQDLITRGITLPVVFISAHRNIGYVVQAIKGGAVDFLLKPLDMVKLREHIDAAFARNRTRLQANDRRADLFRLMANLTVREREVFDLAMAGKSNKEIAQALGISFRTVETHRAHILLKGNVRNIFELCRMVGEAGSSFLEE